MIHSLDNGWWEPDILTYELTCDECYETSTTYEVKHYNEIENKAIKDGWKYDHGYICPHCQANPGEKY